MSLLQEQAPSDADRLTISIGGKLFEDFERVEIVRDLEEIAGGVTIEGLDHARLQEAFPGWWRLQADRGPLRPGEKMAIEINGEPVLFGWLDEVVIDYSATKAGARLRGRDVTGDLVDCAAAPFGPAEYSNITLLDLCRAICKPFGIVVRTEVEVPERFAKFGIEIGETALDAIAKACNQREVLPVSDGLGALVLTRGGRTMGPASLIFGRNIVSASATFGRIERFSDYLVKGQTRPQASAQAPRLSDQAPTLDEALISERRPSPSSPSGSRSRVVMTGRARDPKVGRYRPAVRMSRTQSGGATVQEQADWWMRTARGKSESLRIVVQGWRAGSPPELWRPNQRVLVNDPLAAVNHELLIVGVTYILNEEGMSTELRLAGIEAFDVLREGEDRARRSRAPASAATADAPTVDEALASHTRPRSGR